MITIVARCKVKEGKKQEFINAVQPLLEGSRNEEGNIFYELYEDIDDGHTVSFIEQWKDEQAIASHNSSSHFRSGVAVIRSLTDGMEVVKYRKL